MAADSTAMGMGHDSDGPDGPGQLPEFGPVRMAWDRSIPGVLKVLVRGVGGDPDAALRRWRHNFQLAREANLHKLLVVLDLTGPVIPEAQLARMISQVAEAGVDEFRIAIVQTRHERQRHDELGVLVAMEHGIAARVFSDEASALLWLRYGAR